MPAASKMTAHPESQGTKSQGHVDSGREIGELTELAARLSLQQDRVKSEVELRQEEAVHTRMFREFMVAEHALWITIERDGGRSWREFVEFMTHNFPAYLKVVLGCRQIMRGYFDFKKMSHHLANALKIIRHVIWILGGLDSLAAHAAQSALDGAVYLSCDELGRVTDRIFHDKEAADEVVDSLKDVIDYVDSYRGRNPGAVRVGRQALATIMKILGTEQLLARVHACPEA